MIFKNPSFLWALSLLALPVIIYLFNFKRFKKVYFSNIRFLQEVVTQTKKQSKLRHLLILLARLLVFAALVVAFANPVIPSSSRKTGRQDRVLIWLDNSFSMQQKGSRGELFEQGRQMAARIAGALPRTSRLMLLSNNREAETEWVDYDDMMADLRNVTVEPYPADFNAVLNRWSSDKARELPSVIYALSDFQKSAFDASAAAADTLVAVHLLPLRAVAADNIFIDTCYIESPVVHSGMPVKVRFKVRQSAPRQGESITVLLRVNGQKRGAVTLESSNTLTPGEIAFVPDSNRFQWCSLTVNDAGIAFDNVFYFSFKISRRIPVVVINGTDSPGFISRFYRSDSTFMLTEYNENQIDYSAFANAKLLILNSLTEVSSGLMLEVKKYVRQGGRLLIIPGPDSRDHLNQLNGDLGLPSFSSIDTTKLKISDIDLQSVLFEDVFDLKNHRLSSRTDMPWFTEHYRMKMKPGQAYHTVMMLEDGSPLLTRWKTQSGEVWYFAALLDKHHSNFGRHALFIPVFYKLAAMQNLNGRLYYSIDRQNINIDYHQQQKDIPFEIVSLRDSSAFIPQVMASGQNTLLNLYGQIHRAGHYLIRRNGRAVWPLSINYNKAESLTETYSREQLQQAIERNHLVNIDIISADINRIEQKINEINQDVPLWKLFISMAAFFLLIELFLLRFLK